MKRRSTLNEPCFQCALDIGHICYAGDPNARWGLHDGAIEALEAAQRYLTGREPPRLSADTPVKEVTSMPVPDFRIPEGWTQEALPRLPDHVLISTPAPSFMVTIDFKARGFRMGYSTSSMFVGEAWNKKRKKYGGRNWKQALVDAAVAHLKKVMK